MTIQPPKFFKKVGIHSTHPQGKTKQPIQGMELQEKEEKNEKYIWKVIIKKRKVESPLLEELLITNLVTFSFNPTQLSNMRCIFYFILLLANFIEPHTITELWRVYETLHNIMAS